jgi:hypothetical protein
MKAIEDCRLNILADQDLADVGKLCICIYHSARIRLHIRHDALFVEGTIEVAMESSWVVLTLYRILLSAQDSNLASRSQSPVRLP